MRELRGIPRTILAPLLALSLAGAANRSAAQDENFTFTAPDTTSYFAASSGAGSVCLELTVAQDSGDPSFPAETQGFTFALAHDASLLVPRSAEAIGIVAELNDGDGPDYFYVNLDLASADGVAIYVIYDFLISGGESSLQFAEESAVVELCYDTVPADLEGDVSPTVTEVAWTNFDSDPPVSNIVTVDLASVDPVLIDAMLTLEPRDVIFLRGDVNGDGVVSSLLDALYLLVWTFSFGPDPPCIASADADDNGSVSALLDALYLLQWVFDFGPDPPAPGTKACGPDPGGPVLECETLPDCP